MCVLARARVLRAHSFRFILYGTDWDACMVWCKHSAGEHAPHCAVDILRRLDCMTARIQDMTTLAKSPQRVLCTPCLEILATRLARGDSPLQM